MLSEPVSSRARRKQHTRMLGTQTRQDNKICVPHCQPKTSSHTRGRSKNMLQNDLFLFRVPNTSLSARSGVVLMIQQQHIWTAMLKVQSCLGPSPLPATLYGHQRYKQSDTTVRAGIALSPLPFQDLKHLDAKSTSFSKEGLIHSSGIDSLAVLANSTKMDRQRRLQ